MSADVSCRNTTDAGDALAKFFNSMLDAMLDHGDDFHDEVKEALVESGLGTDAGYGVARGEYLGVVLTDLGKRIRGDRDTDTEDWS